MSVCVVVVALGLVLIIRFTIIIRILIVYSNKAWWAFQPRKKIFSPPPLPTDIPLAPFPRPRLLLGPPPFPLFLIKNRPPATLSPPQNRKNI